MKLINLLIYIFLLLMVRFVHSHLNGIKLLQVALWQGFSKAINSFNQLYHP